MRANSLLHLCGLWALTSLVLWTTGCTTAGVVSGPDRVNVLVYPMHGAGVQEPMTKVVRLQRSGNGFILLSVDKCRVHSKQPFSDYVEVLPGRHTLLLIPGHERIDGSSSSTVSRRNRDEGFLLSLDVKPNAWYHFCTYVTEVVEGTETTTKTQSGNILTTVRSRRVGLAPFEVLEILDGKTKTVATEADFSLQ